MVRVVLIGLGSMGRLTLRYLVERKAKVVGVFTRSTNIEADAGKIAGVGPINIAVSAVSKLETLLPSMRADICLLLTTGLISEMSAVLEVCASAGVNTFCLGEDAYFPQPFAPVAFANLDNLAKENSCTISGGGVYDASWGHLVTVLTASAHNLKEIRINCITDMDRYYQGTPGVGAKLSRSYLGIGMTLQEFTEHFPAFNSVEARQEPSGLAGGVTSWICAYMNWTVTSVKQYYEPITATNDIFFRTINSKITSGLVVGAREVTIRETKEGIRLVLEFAMKAYDEHEEDVSEICVVADPCYKVSIEPGNVAEFSCVNMVNRIPDIVAAPPGYVTTNRLPPPKYVHSLA